MKNKIYIYIGLIIMSLLLFGISMTILSHTKFIAPILIAISIYFFLGSLIKLCKINDKLKNTIYCIIDLLFWLP